MILDAPIKFCPIRLAYSELMISIKEKLTHRSNPEFIFGCFGTVAKND